MFGGFGFEVCDILVGGFTVTLAAGIEHMSFSRDVPPWMQCASNFSRIFVTFHLSSSFSQENVL